MLLLCIYIYIVYAYVYIYIIYEHVYVYIVMVYVHLLYIIYKTLRPTLCILFTSKIEDIRELIQTEDAELGVPIQIEDIYIYF